MDFFPPNSGTVSDEQGERFCRDIVIMEKRYQGKSTVNMLSDYCWMIIRTPKSAVSESEPVKRLRDPKTAEELYKIGKIELKSFHKTKEGGFKNIELQDIDKVKVHEIPEQVKVSELDFCFLYARAKTDNENFPSFHGFMARIMKNDTFQVSKIKVLPFINAPASHLDTI